MTAYRRKDRPSEGYRIEPTLPQPWGKVGPWQTGFRTKRDGQRVESWLREEALRRPALIDALVCHDFTLRDAWTAHQRGALDELIAGLTDPPLVDAIDRYRPLTRDARARQGLEWLRSQVPAGARLSWLDSRRIREIYAEALRTMKPNSVRRGPHRAISELLLFDLGSAARAEILRDVKVPSEDDTRHVDLTKAEIKRLLDACEPVRFRALVTLAVVTTADQKPLRALTPTHFDPDAGTLTIPDRKNRARWRVVRLEETGLTALRLACTGLSPRDRLFPWTESQARWMWLKARQRADLPGLRFKDLRHLFPTELAKAGVDRRTIEGLLGHRPGSRMTGRYITPAGNVQHLGQAAASLGLAGSHMRAG